MMNTLGALVPRRRWALRPARWLPSRRLLARLCAAFALHCACLTYTEHVGAKAELAQEFVDVGFATLPRLREGYGDFLPFAFLTAVVVTLYANEAWPELEEYLTLVAGLMSMRAVSVASTVLPPSDSSCYAGGPLAAALHGGCHDKVFSGHVAYMTLSAFYLRRGFGRVVWALVAVEAAYLVSSRAHYTVDVLVALSVAALLFHACSTRGYAARHAK